MNLLLPFILLLTALCGVFPATAAFPKTLDAPPAEVWNTKPVANDRCRWLGAPDRQSEATGTRKKPHFALERGPVHF